MAWALTGLSEAKAALRVKFSFFSLAGVYRTARPPAPYAVVAYAKHGAKLRLMLVQRQHAREAYSSEIATVPSHIPAHHRTGFTHGLLLSFSFG